MIPKLDILRSNPSEHPLTYPGEAAGRSCLLLDSELYYLACSDQGIATWRVQGHPGEATLDDILGEAGMALMAGRLPVVAVGSNAAPAQLAYKYRATPGRTAIPITLGSVSNLSITHSAHISKPGYVPLTPILAPNASLTKFHILWLNRAQFQRLDETEPNYSRGLVLPSTCTATLESGEVLTEFSIYRSRWGALRAEPGGPPVKAMPQERIFAQLGGMEWFRELVPEIQAGPEAAATALAGDEQRRVNIRDGLAVRGLAANDGL